MFVLLLRILLTRAVPDADVAGFLVWKVFCISGFLMVWKVCAIDLLVLVLVRALFRSSSRTRARTRSHAELEMASI